MTKQKKQKATPATQKSQSPRYQAIDKILRQAGENIFGVPAFTFVAYHMKLDYPAVRQWCARGVPEMRIEQLAALARLTPETVRKANKMEG